MSSVKLAGQEYSLAPLSIGDLQDCWDDVGAIGTQPNAIVQSKHILKILAYSIAHGHPGVTYATLMKSCTMADFQAMTAAMSEVLSISGMAPKEGETGEEQEKNGTGMT